MRQLTDLAALAAFQEAHPEALVIDVRTEEEFQAQHLDGAVHHPEATILSNLAHADKEAPVAVYCNRGIKSKRVAEKLEAAGFSQVYNLTPGLKG